MAHLSICLFGPLYVALDGQAATGFAYNKARALLAYLAVEADRPHQRDHLVEMFWPGLPASAGRTNLRQTLANLREAIGEDAASPTYLLATRDTLQFNPAAEVDLDIAVFRRHIAACDAHRHRRRETCRACAARLEECVRLYRGDFLAEFSVGDSSPFEEWALVCREGFRAESEGALRHLALIADRRGERETACRHLRRLLELDPWREEAHRHLMDLLARMGQRSAALAQYEDCRRSLTENLHIEPAFETTHLAQQIRSGAWPAAAMASATGRLPGPPSALIGRNPELNEIEAMLDNPACRLISLVGVPGVGKSRLALEAARRADPSFRDGAVFVSLSSVTDAVGLAIAIVRALAIPLQGGHDDRSRLLRFMQSREMLLVLDGIEAVRGAAELLSELLRGAPAVTILATSQQRLGLQAEWVFNLDGLPFPPLSKPESAASQAAYEAADLFVERARQLDRAFAPSRADWRYIHEICRMVEGLPLAIELAAGLVEKRPLASVAEQIGSDLLGVSAEEADRPPKHRSVWAAFEQSWSLLDDTLRTVLATLTVFKGGYDEPAAVAVAGASQAQLLELAGKSLVRRGLDGRFELHNLVNQFAARKLAGQGGEAAARKNHAHYYAALAARAAALLYGSERLGSLRTLERDHDNLRAALAWAMPAGERDLAAHLASDLAPFWLARGFYKEGWVRLMTVISEAAGLPTALEARLRTETAALALALGDYSEAGKLADCGLALAKSAGDEPVTISALCVLEALARQSGDFVQAESLALECLRRAESSGDALAVAESECRLGITCHHKGDLDQARRYYEQCLGGFRMRGYSPGVAETLFNFGMLAHAQNDLEQAAAYYAECLELSRAIGDAMHEAYALHNLGLAALDRGALAEAELRMRESLRLRNDMGDREALAWALEGCAELALALGNPRQAAVLLGTVECLREQLGAPMPPANKIYYERTLARLRTGLNDALLAEAWEEGRHLSAEEAADRVLASA